MELVTITIVGTLGRQRIGNSVIIQKQKQNDALREHAVRIDFYWTISYLLNPQDSIEMFEENDDGDQSEIFPKG